ncbi:MAG: LysR substrate-binding domain-containing protein [Burkholderiaceae bacterium]
MKHQDSVLGPTAAVSGQRFTLRQLESFAEIALRGSISAAAVRLSRTQSAVSMTLAELESTLGVALFERRGRRLVRTEVAERLLPRAIEIVERARDIHRLVDPDEARTTRIALGASRTIGPSLMPDLIRTCRERISGLQATITIANSEDLLRQIADFGLDYAFVEGDVLDPFLIKQAWLSDELCLFAREDHPLFSQKRQSLRQLTQWEWVLREPGSGTREIFLRAISQVLPEQPQVALQVNDAETQKRIVRDSDWLGCMSRRILSPDAGRDGLREIAVPKRLSRALTRRFWIVRHPERLYSAAMAAVNEAALSLG